MNIKGPESSCFIHHPVLKLQKSFNDTAQFDMCEIKAVVRRYKVLNERGINA